MRNAEARRRTIIAGGVLVTLLAVPLAAALTGQPFWISIATRIVILALLAVSLDFILGYGGMVSFGHAAYFAVGGYGVAIAAFHGNTSALVSWPLAVIAAALLGLAIGALSLRTSGVYFIMITLAFAQMLFYVINSVKYYGGDDGLSMTARDMLPGIDLRNPAAFYFVCLVALVGFKYLCRRIVDSRFGMVLRGCKQSERRLVSLGYPVFRYKLTAFVIAAAGAGLAGVLWANNARIASPDMTSWTRSGEILMMVILGGVGTLVGPVLGAALFVGLETWLSALTEHWLVVLGPILILIVLFAKRGLYGWLGGRDA